MGEQGADGPARELSTTAPSPAGSPPWVARLLAALLLTSWLGAAACGDDGASGTTTSGPAAPADRAPADAVGGTTAAPSDPAGEDRFVLTTDTDDIRVSGPTTGPCVIGGGTSLEVTFSDGTNDVEVAAASGSGTVVVAGVFEGRIDQVQLGDAGEVFLSGRGSLADDTAEPATFVVRGRCG